MERKKRSEKEKNAKIKRVQQQPSSFQGENIGGKY